MKEFEIEFKTKVKNTEEGCNGSWFNYYRCEFVVQEAGDTLTFRVYDDGRVYER